MYPIRPKNAKDYLKYGNGGDSGEEVTTLSELSSLLHEDTEKAHIEFMKFLGFQQINATKLQLTFTERGKIYADPKHDRMKTTDELYTKEFTLDMEINGSNLKDYLPMLMEIDRTPFLEDNVNYLAMITFTCQDDDAEGVVNLPLVGRGTFALEGKLNDIFSGYCIGGPCASFQQRAAIIASVIQCLPIKNRAEIMRDLQKQLNDINKLYHGRQPALDYIFGVLDGSIESTYRSYMKYRFGSNIYNDPPQAFFDGVNIKLTDEERQEEEDNDEGMEIRKTKTKNYTGTGFPLIGKVAISGGIVVAVICVAIGVGIFILKR